MAKSAKDAATAAREIINDVEKGLFAPVYLLMGEESYYIDLVARSIIDNALTDDERDFNQFISYGSDITVDDLISNARRYPMFAERQIVVLKEAQKLRGIENLAVYIDAPLDSTVLVLVYRGNIDKRKALYKSVSKNGRVLESVPVRDYEITRWITDFYAGKGLNIEPDAAALLGESAGTDLNKIVVETEKMLKNLPEGTTSITHRDIENNVGISREFSIFELTRQLSYRQIPQALRTASYIGADAQFAMPKATAALFMHFNRILKYEALMLNNPNPDPSQKQAVLGVAPFFFREYDAAVRNYPLKRCMAAISLIKDYDFKGKGGDSGEATAQELLIELVTKLLS